MKSVFVDTSGWIGLVNTGDSLHEAATRAYHSKYIEGCLFVTHKGNNAGDRQWSVRIAFKVISFRPEAEIGKV